MTIKEFVILTTKVCYGDYQPARPRILCKDGFSMSVQAGYGIYSYPRLSGEKEYSEFEIGCPSSEEDLINEYAEDPAKPTRTVYGFVPSELVEKVIDKHGGIEEDVMLFDIEHWRYKHGEPKDIRKELQELRQAKGS